MTEITEFPHHFYYDSMDICTSGDADELSLAILKHVEKIAEHMKMFEGCEVIMRAPLTIVRERTFEGRYIARVYIRLTATGRTPEPKNVFTFGSSA